MVILTALAHSCRVACLPWIYAFFAVLWFSFIVFFLRTARTASLRLGSSLSDHSFCTRSVAVCIFFPRFTSFCTLGFMDRSDLLHSVFVLLDLFHFLSFSFLFRRGLRSRLDLALAHITLFYAFTTLRIWILRSFYSHLVVLHKIGHLVSFYHALGRFPGSFCVLLLDHSRFRFLSVFLVTRFVCVSRSRFSRLHTYVSRLRSFSGSFSYFRSSRSRSFSVTHRHIVLFLAALWIIIYGSLRFAFSSFASVTRFTLFQSRIFALVPRCCTLSWMLFSFFGSRILRSLGHLVSLLSVCDLVHSSLVSRFHIFARFVFSLSSSFGHISLSFCAWINADSSPGCASRTALRISFCCAHRIVLFASPRILLNSP